MEIEISDFTGCKIALFCGDKLLTILRDDKASIPWANMWELPGGGYESRDPWQPSVYRLPDFGNPYIRNESQSNRSAPYWSGYWVPDAWKYHHRYWGA